MHYHIQINILSIFIKWNRLLPPLFLIWCISFFLCFFFFLHVIRNRAWNLPFSCVSSSDQLLIYMYIFWMQAKWMPFDKNSVQRERKNGLTQWQPFSAFSELVSPGLALRGILRQWWGSVLQTLHLEQVEQLRSMKQPCPQLQHQANSWVIVFVSSPLLGSLL